MEQAMDFMYEDTDPRFLEKIWSEHPELYGRPEIWKPITKQVIADIPEGIYFVSLYGRVFSTVRNRFLKSVKTDNGYYRVFLQSDDPNKNKRYHLLHRIVMLTFYPIPFADEFQVNHKDGIKSHNWFWNLEWSTCSENRIHAINMGLVKVIGEDHPMHIISEQIAYEIGRLLSTTNMTAKEISNYLGNGVTESIVYNIMNGSSWLDVYKTFELYNINRNPSVMTDDQIHSLCKYFETYKDGSIGFGQRTAFIENALTVLGIQITSSSMRLAERLYYKLTHKKSVIYTIIRSSTTILEGSRAPIILWEPEMGGIQIG